MLVLHGSPGATHNYLLPLADLATLDFDLIFYDQSGCGNSDDLERDEDYSFRHGVEEAECVRNAIFGEEKVNLLVDSFGAAMALFYAIKYPAHLKTLISTSIAFPN